MKIRTYILALVALTTLVGCSRTTIDITTSELYGSWVVSGVDNNTLNTNDWFALTFGSDMSYAHDYRVAFDTGNAIWNQTSNASYRVNNDYIIITAPDDDLYLKIMAEISTYSTTDLMVYTVIEHTKNGIICGDVGVSYSAIREGYTFKDVILGTWEGRCVTQGRDETPLRLEFSVGGTYRYFTQNNLLEWVEKTDNQGEYYLYGSLIAATWSNNATTGVSGEQCELWQIDISNNTMAFVARRADIGSIRYDFTKVN